MNKVKTVRTLIRGAKDISAKVRAGDMAGAAQEAAETGLQVAVLAGAVVLVPVVGPWAAAWLAEVGVEASVELVAAGVTALTAFIASKRGMRKVRQKSYEAAYDEPEVLPDEDEEVPLPDGTTMTMGELQELRALSAGLNRAGAN